MRHFIRVHYCDIIGPIPNFSIFSLYIDSKFRQEIEPYIKGVYRTATPFYNDFVVDSDDCGIMKISVGANVDNTTLLMQALLRLTPI